MKCPNCYNDTRAGAKFCPHCGHPLTAGQKTQLVRPRADPPAPPPPPPPAAPPAYKPPLYAPPVQPSSVQPPPVQPPSVQPLGGVSPVRPARRGLRRPAWPVLAGVGAVLLLALAGLWFLFLRGGGAAAGVPQGNRVLYGIAETASSGLASKSVGVLGRDGDWAELAFDRDGILVRQAPADGYASVAPDGRRLAIYRDTRRDGLELSLIATEGGAESYSDSGTGWELRHGFSAGSDAFAFTRYDDSDEVYTLVVVGAGGQPLGEWEDLIFAGFFDDGQRLLAMRLDDEGRIDDLATVTLPDGQPERVATLDDSSAEVSPFVFNDAAYYYYNDELRRVDANGENASTIYRFGSELPAVSVLPGLDKLLVLERPEFSTYGDLYIVEPDGSARVRVDEAVYIEPGAGGSGAAAYAAANGRLAYTAVDNDSLSLFVINTDGRNRRRLADGREWLTFAFSPDGRWLGYIAGKSYEQPGELYVVELPDGDPIRLARNAWSLMYSGNRLLYTSVTSAEGDDPESSVLSVTYGGDAEEVIFGPEDGLIRLISPVR